jgi:hypothetical protein
LQHGSLLARQLGFFIKAIAASVTDELEEKIWQVREREEMNLMYLCCTSIAYYHLAQI